MSFWACKPSINSYADYLKYLNDDDNGLIKSYSKNGLKTNMKYLPEEYLIVKELHHEGEGVSEDLVKKLKTQYKSSITFLMTFRPEKGEDYDVTKIGVFNYEEFGERIMKLTFSLKEQLTLISNGEEYKPVLTQFEEIFGLRNDRNVLIVFNLSETERKDFYNNDFTIKYFDDVFQLGEANFDFNHQDILEIPKVAYLQ